jgi:anti-sigma regulatory factor (Ser/Thr protein kinase)
VSLTVVGVLILMTQVEYRFMGRAQVVESEIVVSEDQSNIVRHIHEALEENDLVLDDVRIHREEGRSAIRVRYHGLARARKRFILDVWGHPAVREVREI